MPLQHSPVLSDHDTGVHILHRLLADGANCATTKMRNTLCDALEHQYGHRDTLLGFGRFPKRNAALSRLDTKPERLYLQSIGDRHY